ncbi:uncharacterized protein BDR25DRAFT_312813 [Lindgomyces ingoldianus]|uniref:Uncharacterized protein n=1 Tax=Lindgomyces ingoldianus TaxID=673940 RepID=A0ACB6R3C0_9PLEO|nr:uncharacterized protein BDR25DRAFT_312813 [Lindgomyces ingoldianus]KAF2472941.1 hypothetical protein BDR25DRAFT_312813 [Lindgomyces ingoldianus]
MSTSAPRFHIPFPKTFLSLNAKPTKLPSVNTIMSPEPEVPTHSFLSNRPNASRHFSISSSTSSGSVTISEPASPTVQAADAANMNGMPAFQTWLPLNAKFNPPPKSAGEMTVGGGVKSPFLSNRG